MAELSAHRAYLDGEWRAARAAPLSLRRAMLVAMLIDAFVDRQFAADPSADDILAYRAARAAAAPALGVVLQICAQADGPKMTLEAVTVPLEAYASLSVEDFMVSLYNDHSVQRVVIAWPDGRRALAHDVLGEAMVALEGMPA